MRTFRREGLAVALSLLLLSILPAAGQEGSWQGPEKGPQLNAQLADKEKNAARRIAVVEVDVRNVTLTDPITLSAAAPEWGICSIRVGQRTLHPAHDQPAGF